MRRLYLLVIIFIGFTVSGCAIMTSNDSSQTSAGQLTPTNTKDTIIPVHTIPQKQIQSTNNTNIKKNITQQKYAYKNPLTVQVYPKGIQLNQPYKVIAKEIISKYNRSGIKRQEASIHDALRSLAAAIGGDAIIDIKHDKNNVSGTVISFQKKIV